MRLPISSPIDAIVALAPGASYLASLACPSCPYQTADPHLVANVTLAADRGTLLLNGEPLYPLPTIPTPPAFEVALRPQGLSNTHLDAALACPDPHCHRPSPLPACAPWCTTLRLSSLRIDYLYTIAPTVDHDDDDEAAVYRELTLDILGGTAGPGEPRWALASTTQPMLWLLIKDKALTRARNGRPNPAGIASDLFGAPYDAHDAHDLEIVDLRLEPRSYSPPKQKPLSLWGSIARFFGADVWEDEGARFLYLGADWGPYGKKGTLRNAFGHLVHWRPWVWIAYLIPGTIAVIAVLAGAYKLYLWIRLQKQLMAWDGIQHVWDKLRVESVVHEEDTLLPDAYWDHPDASSSSPSFRYTDEPHTMKSLPSKPLPEKPLPSVPLIDT